MAPDPTQLVVAGTGAIYVAPVGTALPATPVASLNAEFTELGYTTDDGLTLKQSRDIKDFFAWQSRDPVRRELISREIMLSFSLEQWNGENLVFALGGGSVTAPGGGTYKYNFPATTDHLDEQALIGDWTDGSKHYRLIVERGNISEDVETKLTRSDLSVLPIGWKALQPTSGVIAYILTDDPAFSALVT